MGIRFSFVTIFLCHHFYVIIFCKFDDINHGISPLPRTAQNKPILTARSKMKKNITSCKGTNAQHGPCLAGKILHDYLENSNEPLAVAFRQQHPDVFENVDAENDGSEILFKLFYPNTEIGINLKLLTRTPGRLPIGELRSGAITHDGDDHYTFLESDVARTSTNGKRNPCIMPGTYINVHRKDDGTLYPTFNRPAYTETFTFQDFCREAAMELLMVARMFGRNCSVGEE